MGETSAELEREIAALRRETESIVLELQQRVHEATDIRTQVMAHPYATAGIGLAFLAGLFLLAKAFWKRRVADNALSTRVRRRAGEIANRSDGFAFARQDGRQAAMLKRVLWAMLTAGSVALVSLLARRLLASLWSATLKEPPPRHDRV